QRSAGRKAKHSKACVERANTRRRGQRSRDRGCVFKRASDRRDGVPLAFLWLDVDAVANSSLAVVVLGRANRLAFLERAIENFLRRSKRPLVNNTEMTGRNIEFDGPLSEDADKHRDHHKRRNAEYRDLHARRSVGRESGSDSEKSGDTKEKNRLGVQGSSRQI